MTEMEDKPVQLKIFDKPFKCTVCDGDTFRQKRAELRGPATSLFRSKDYALCLICAKCGYVHWFMPKMGSYGPQASTNKPGEND